jgi:hypothetical protein
MKNSFFFWLFFFPLLSFAHKEFSPDQKMRLQKGELLTEVNWKEGYIWPEVKIYSLLSHSPEKNLAVFLDFNSHKKYIPDMLESKIIKKDSHEIQVYFEMEMPWPVKKSTHITSNTISSEKDGSHKLSWSLIKADWLKATDGHMIFSPFEGKTLLTYVSLIVPNSPLASMFKNRVAQDVEKSVREITRHLHRTLKKTN